MIESRVLTFRGKRKRERERERSTVQHQIFNILVLKSEKPKQIPESN